MCPLKTKKAAVCIGGVYDLVTVCSSFGNLMVNYGEWCLPILFAKDIWYKETSLDLYLETDEQLMANICIFQETWN